MADMEIAGLGAVAASGLLLSIAFYQVGVRALPRLVSRRFFSPGPDSGPPLNALVHRGLNNARNCRTPMAVADALVSSCVFDLRRGPLRLRCRLPEDSYWSLTVFDRRTDNVAVLNDRDPRARGRQRIELSLKWRGGPDPTPAGAGSEDVLEVDEPVGLILVRQVVADPTDPERVRAARRDQEGSWAREASADPSRRCRVFLTKDVWFYAFPATDEELRGLEKRYRRVESPWGRA